jgi:DNA polymerase III gamma/tau subunit
MTYILVNKSEEGTHKGLENLLKQIYSKDISQSPDIHKLDPEDENSIGIEEIKKFQKEMMYKPFQEDIQTGIIYQSEKLTTQAQNALLKTLEDSNDNSVYILCVNNEKNLLPTITSRGKIIYSTNDIAQKDEENSALKDILEKNILEQFNSIEEFSKSKESAMEFINHIEFIFQNRLELDIKNGKIDSAKENLSFLKIVQESRGKISANCNRRLTLEAMLMQLNA